MTTGDDPHAWLIPGSETARKAGCTCRVGESTGRHWISLACPVHAPSIGNHLKAGKQVLACHVIAGAAAVQVVAITRTSTVPVITPAGWRNEGRHPSVSAWKR